MLVMFPSPLGVKSPTTWGQASRRQSRQVSVPSRGKEPNNRNYTHEHHRSYHTIKFPSPLGVKSPTTYGYRDEVSEDVREVSVPSRGKEPNN